MNIQMYKNKIANIDWNSINQMDDINLANDFFENEILKVLESEAPKLERNTNNGYQKIPGTS